MLVQNYKREYNKKIDFWKFIFSILIVFSHGIYLADVNSGDKLIFGDALIGVEFYFIISGYFLVQSIYSRDETIISFMYRTIKNLFPYFFISFIFGYLVWAILFLDRRR